MHAKLYTTRTATPTSKDFQGAWGPTPPLALGAMCGLKALAVAATVLAVRVPELHCPILHAAVACCSMRLRLSSISEVHGFVPSCSPRRSPGSLPITLQQPNIITQYKRPQTLPRKAETLSSKSRISQNQTAPSTPTPSSPNSAPGEPKTHPLSSGRVISAEVRVATPTQALVFRGFGSCFVEALEVLPLPSCMHFVTCFGQLRGTLFRPPWNSWRLRRCRRASLGPWQLASGPWPHASAGWGGGG